MPNQTTTEEIKRILREKGCITASEISALGVKLPGQKIYQMRKRGLIVKTVRTPTDIEYHLEEGG